MDCEVTFGRLVLASIPPRGASYRTIAREVGVRSLEALDAALKSLQSAGVVQQLLRHGRMIWFRAERVPELFIEKRKNAVDHSQAVKPKRRGVTRIPRLDRYNGHGHRLCTKAFHYVATNEFSSCPRNADGLHNWCRKCKAQAARDAREH